MRTLHLSVMVQCQSGHMTEGDGGLRSLRTLTLLQHLETDLQKGFDAAKVGLETNMAALSDRAMRAMKAETTLNHIRLIESERIEKFLGE